MVDSTQNKLNMQDFRLSHASELTKKDSEPNSLAEHFEQIKNFAKFLKPRFECVSLIIQKENDLISKTPLK